MGEQPQRPVASVVTVRPARLAAAEAVRVAVLRPVQLRPTAAMEGLITHRVQRKQRAVLALVRTELTGTLMRTYRYRAAVVLAALQAQQELDMQAVQVVTMEQVAVVGVLLLTEVPLGAAEQEHQELLL